MIFQEDIFTPDHPHHSAHPQCLEIHQERHPNSPKSHEQGFQVMLESTLKFIL